LSEQVLQISNLEKSFGKAKILKAINFSLQKGEVYGLIGENGAGKTTLLRLITGLMKPSCGNIFLNTEKNFIGYMPQSCRFDDNSSVAKTIRFFSNLRKAKVDDSFDLCKRLGLDRVKKVKHLSPGQQKKMQIIIAMMGNPDLYVLDEPTAGLDPSATYEMTQIIHSIHDTGKSIIVSSHILQDMDGICTNVAIMDKGNLIYNRRIETSYIVKTRSLSDEVLSRIKSRYCITHNVDHTVLNVKVDKDNISDFIKYLTSSSVDILEVTVSNVKSIAQEHMNIKGDDKNE